MNIYSNQSNKCYDDIEVRQCAFFQFEKRATVRWKLNFMICGAGVCHVAAAAAGVCVCVCVCVCV